MAIKAGRRQFIYALGGAVAAWPLATRAQQATVPVVGFLNPGSPEATRYQAVAFVQGMNQAGYVEGRNVAVEYRWANGQYDQLPAIAADLVRRQVAVIGVISPVGALAAKQATTSTPIVFAVGSDPVRDGLVGSLSRPGGNITGATFFANLLDAKRVELLHQLVPEAKVIVALLNTKNANFELERDETQKAVRALGLEFVLLQATNEREIDDSFVTVAQQRAVALFVAGDAFLGSRADQIVKLAARYAVPTSFALREQMAAGGLMSYGASLTETVRQAGNYVGRILKGEKAGDLPVQQPTKFEFILNMKTAKALGLTVPYSIQLLADEVIE
jgi:putative ABC transport system substrate-binding protein